MTTTTAHKRLDEIETYLTPKEWAIRLADEARKHAGPVAYVRALAKLPLDELPMRRPYFAFEEQAGYRHPGHKPEDIRARNHLTEALWSEFHTLGLLWWWVNMAMQRKVESIGSQAALRLSALHALILQDALAQTARQTTVLLTKQKQSGAKAEREAVLKLLAALTEVDICETLSHPVPPEDHANRYPSPLAEWNHELTALLKDFYAHRAAVELVQGRHFNGHPILFLDLETELATTARTIESAVATANEYLKRRAERDGAGTSGGSNLAIALESIRASAKGQRAAGIAERWLHDVSQDAVETDEE
jgi:hypothetical protein